MAASSVSELRRQISEVRQNPGLPHEVGKNLSHDDLRKTMAGTRTALVAAVTSAPESAFESQSENDDGEEVWSVGEIVGHCNGSVISIGGSALSLAGIDAGDPPEDLSATSEPRVMSRDEALSAAQAIDIDAFFAMIPDGDALDNTNEHDFFGTMSARSWLYFMAMHEADHVQQIEDLG